LPVQEPRSSSQEDLIFSLDDEELKRALGISEGVAVGPFCSALRLAPFNNDQIAGALRWMPQQRIQTFLDKLDALPQLLEIARRPSLLFQVAQLWNMRRIDIETTNIYSGTIVRKFVTYSLERQIEKQRTDIASGRADRQFIPLTLAEIDYFTVGCAIAALSDGRNNSLPATILRSTIARMLDSVAQRALPLSRGETGALTMPLSERVADKNDPVEAIVQAVRTHGVIEHEPSKPGLYRFSHKSFVEALTAEVLSFKAMGIDLQRGYLDALPVNELVSQDAVLLFCMDIAAANTARSSAGLVFIIRNLTNKNFLITTSAVWIIPMLALLTSVESTVGGRRFNQTMNLLAVMLMLSFVVVIAFSYEQLLPGGIVSYAFLMGCIYFTFTFALSIMGALNKPLVTFAACLVFALDSARRGVPLLGGSSRHWHQTLARRRIVKALISLRLQDE
jgi:hypothetical protein